MPKLLIFDFDGTIADTKSVYYKSILDEIRNYGFSAKEVDKAIDIGLSLRGTLAKLGFGFATRWFLKRKIMNSVKSNINEVKKCKDVDAIKKIKIKKILITNSLKEFALPILKHSGLNRAFSEIYGAEDFDDKAEFIKNYLKKAGINKKECYYIGDRASDVKLAREAGIKSIAVAGKCAWDSRKEVLAARPDFVVSELDEISEIVS